MNILLHTFVTLYQHFVFNNSSFYLFIFSKQMEMLVLWITCAVECPSEKICIWRVWLVNSLSQWKIKSLFWSNGCSDEYWVLCDVSLAESFTLRKWRWPPELHGRAQCLVLCEVLNAPTLEGVGGWLADQVGSLPCLISVHLTFPESLVSYRLPCFYHVFCDAGLFRL